MENNTFKSVPFGGFDKQAVVQYIEKAAQEHTAAMEALQQEKDALDAQTSQQAEELGSLRSQVDALTAERDALRADLERETAARQALEPFRPQAEQLAAEVERLRPDARAYAQFREEIGAIECEARQRAADLEASTVTKLTALAAAFRTRYQDLAGTFDTTATHVTGELRRVEVNLSQLPRALDQIGTELNELETVLKAANPQQ